MKKVILSTDDAIKKMIQIFFNNLTESFEDYKKSGAFENHDWYSDNIIKLISEEEIFDIGIRQLKDLGFNPSFTDVVSLIDDIFKIAMNDTINKYYINTKIKKFKAEKALNKNTNFEFTSLKNWFINTSYKAFEDVKTYFNLLSKEKRVITLLDYCKLPEQITIFLKPLCVTSDSDPYGYIAIVTDMRGEVIDTVGCWFQPSPVKESESLGISCFKDPLMNKHLSYGFSYEQFLKFTLPNLKNNPHLIDEIEEKRIILAKGCLKNHFNDFICKYKHGVALVVDNVQLNSNFFEEYYFANIPITDFSTLEYFFKEKEILTIETKEESILIQLHLLKGKYFKLLEKMKALK